MTYITDSTIPFTTVIEMSSLTGTAPYGGNYLCYLPRYVPCDDPIFESSDSDIESQFLTGFKRMFPEIDNDDIVASHLARARFVMAIPTKNYLTGLPGIETGLPRIRICNSAQIVNAALAVTESVDLANRITPTLLGHN